MQLSADALLGTLLASAVGAFFAAWLCFRYALSRFQRERAFDRRLAWYEKAVGMLLGAYDRINWALAGDLIVTSSEERQRACSEAYEALYRLRSLAAEAELYSAPESVDVVREVSEQVIAIAQASHGGAAGTEGLPLPPPERLISLAGKMLRHAAATLSADLREHLGLPPIDRPWSIYDHDYRAFIEELRRHKEGGVDYSGGAWNLFPDVENQERTLPDGPSV